ncbi:hypothetical protein M0802_002321 [Mischocyttarus mexicanus]|nr:hypothetical protein M0802_002321 [Mischocyttarus mexicanus]
MQRANANVHVCIRARARVRARASVSARIRARAHASTSARARAHASASARARVRARLTLHGGKSSFQFRSSWVGTYRDGSPLITVGPSSRSDYKRGLNLRESYQSTDIANGRLFRTSSACSLSVEFQTVRARIWRFLPSGYYPRIFGILEGVAWCCAVPLTTGTLLPTSRGTRELGNRICMERVGARAPGRLGQTAEWNDYENIPTFDFQRIFLRLWLSSTRP